MPQTVWYRYQAPVSGEVKVGLTSDVADGFVEMFSGTDFGSLQADGCFPSAQGTQFTYLQAGATYYFQVGTQSDEPATLGSTLQPPRPPTNDDLGQARSLDSLPLHDFVDMSSATFGPSDPTDCFSGIPNVWYSLTPAVETKLAIAQELGQPAFAVYSGSPGALQLVSCGSLPYVLDAKPGTTYLIEILASDPSISVAFSQAFSLSAVSVAPRVVVNTDTGTATVTGSIRCNAGGDGLVSLTVTQRLNNKIHAYGVLTLFPSCGPAATAWQGVVVPYTGDGVGPFRPGKGTVTVAAEACGTPPGGVLTCDSASVTQDAVFVPGT